MTSWRALRATFSSKTRRFSGVSLPRGFLTSLPTWTARRAHFPDEITWSYPLTTAVLSLTGERCALDCAHCGGHYLGGMRPIWEAAPDGSQSFQKNLDRFLDHLTQIESELGELLTPFQGRSFLVFHPSFGYFADSFKLRQEAVEVEGKSPSPRQLTAIIKLAQGKNIKAIFIQPQFDKRAAQRIAQAIGGNGNIHIPWVTFSPRELLGRLTFHAQRGYQWTIVGRRFLPNE